MNKLTKKEAEICQKIMDGSSLSPEQADLALSVLSKLHKQVAFFRKTWKCEVRGGGGSFWSIHEKDVQKKFDQMVDKSKNQEVVLYECCQGKDTPIKKYDPGGK